VLHSHRFPSPEWKHVSCLLQVHPWLAQSQTTLHCSPENDKQHQGLSLSLNKKLHRLIYHPIRAKFNSFMLALFFCALPFHASLSCKKLWNSGSSWQCHWYFHHHYWHRIWDKEFHNIWQKQWWRTASSRILEVLKSRYMTGLTASWRKASPRAAPSAIFIRVAQDKGIAPSATPKHLTCLKTPWNN